MKRWKEMFSIPFQNAFKIEYVYMVIYANTFHLLFMANDLVKSFEIRKCQLWRMLYVFWCPTRWWLHRPHSLCVYVSQLLRTVFLTGHLDRIFEHLMSRTQYYVTSNPKEKRIENAFQHITNVLLVAANLILCWLVLVLVSTERLTFIFLLLPFPLQLLSLSISLFLSLSLYQSFDILIFSHLIFITIHRLQYPHSHTHILNVN